MKQLILIAALVASISACTSKQAPKEKTEPIWVETNLRIEGMTCDHCEESIQKGVIALAGIDSISANHQDSSAFVRFNASETNLDKIVEAIEGRGFQVAQK
jgi:copper chaperone CopZ